MHPARRYDYMLGGTTNFAADRAAGDAVLAVYPQARVAALENRAFLQRAAHFLAAEAGVRQFLDIGTGIPTSPNLHEVVQSVAPEARVVYADKDPLVLAHSRALLAGTPEGRTAYLHADLLDPRRILGSAEVADVLDLTRPVGLTLMAVVHFLDDATHPYDVVRTLVDALPPGSYLAMSHMTLDFLPPDQARQLGAISTAEGSRLRSRAEFARFFDGLELVPPGIAVLSEWRRAPGESPASRADVSGYGAVARIG
ncbi:SAM-dependent methyltransferase [Cryptosporangium phraense]|uniref:SAM-dependent methyltransferase n=2 Tax=Cryptosporangium phraense TaxID=2593070 RepID=A0A545AKD8_9ACTN|nr:SAM-dependent methyltransferase [Cryptosporangium phraense]